MKRLNLVLVLVLLLAWAGGARAADVPLPLLVAHGIVDKVDKETVTIQPRVDGKFGKAIVLRLTGTSRITTLTSRDSGGKVIAVQRETDPKDLRPRQTIAVTYTTTREGHVLLTAVVPPPSEK